MNKLQRNIEIGEVIVCTGLGHTYWKVEGGNGITAANMGQTIFAVPVDADGNVLGQMERIQSHIDVEQTNKLAKLMWKPEPVPEHKKDGWRYVKVYANMSHEDDHTFGIEIWKDGTHYDTIWFASQVVRDANFDKWQAVGHLGDVPDEPEEEEGEMGGLLDRLTEKLMGLVEKEFNVPTAMEKDRWDKEQYRDYIYTCIRNVVKEEIEREGQQNDGRE